MRFSRVVGDVNFLNLDITHRAHVVIESCTFSVSPHDLNGLAETRYPTLDNSFPPIHSDSFGDKSITQLVVSPVASPLIQTDPSIC